jgi:hypothetical protein
MTLARCLASLLPVLGRASQIADCAVAELLRDYRTVAPRDLDFEVAWIARRLGTATLVVERGEFLELRDTVSPGVLLAKMLRNECIGIER